MNKFGEKLLPGYKLGLLLAGCDIRRPIKVRLFNL